MSEYAHPASLVSTQWAADNLDNPQIRFVEVVWAKDEAGREAAYDSGHIPGAVAWAIIDELALNFGDPINGDIVGKNAIESLLSRSGVTPEMGIVLYDRISSVIAAYTFWLLKYYGHHDVRLLDGNGEKWFAEGRETETIHPESLATTYAAQAPNEKIRASRERIVASIGNAKSRFVDARTREMFSGENNAGAKRGGHIPGAVNLAAWRKTNPDGSGAGWGVPTMNDDGTFKSADELNAMVQELGITPDKEIVTYCVGGGLSSLAWFALTQLLGYENVREYERSWNEWGNLPETPIET